MHTKENLTKSEKEFHALRLRLERLSQEYENLLFSLDLSPITEKSEDPLALLPSDVRATLEKERQTFEEALDSSPSYRPTERAQQVQSHWLFVR